MGIFKSGYSVSGRMTETPWFRKAVSVLLAAAMTCTAAGCDKNDSLPVDDMPDTSQETSESGSDIPAEFDFDAAVKNITVFGNKISLPCTIRDFGEDFSLREEYMSVFDDIASCGLLYQGKSIGVISMIGYADGDDLKDKQIGAIMFGFIASDDYPSDEIREILYEQRGWYSGLIEVDFGGFSFESTEAEVASVFGEPREVGMDSVYRFDSDGQGNSAEIEFYQGKVKIIHIYLNN